LTRRLAGANCPCKVRHGASVSLIVKRGNRHHSSFLGRNLLVSHLLLGASSAGFCPSRALLVSSSTRRSSYEYLSHSMIVNCSLMNSRKARVLGAAFNIFEYLPVRNTFNCLSEPPPIEFVNFALYYLRRSAAGPHLVNDCT
jgi:hypothetical protein